MELFSAFFVLTTTSFILLWIWLKNKRNLWTNLGVDTPPYSLFLGHLRTPYFHGGSSTQRVSLIYDYVKSKRLKYAGLYQFFEPWFVPLDLEILKSIMQSDFQYFTDRGINEVSGEPLTSHLMCLKGQKWKQMRRKLTPAFTSGKMKMMFETLVDCTDGLKKVMDLKLQSPEIDIKDILGRFTTDIIGSCAFGIECNCLENPHNEFREKGKAVFQVPNRVSSNISRILISKYPYLMKLFNKRMIPEDIHNFFLTVVKDTVEYREKNNVYRKDLMQLLIDLKNNKKIEDQGQLIEGNPKNEDNTITISEIAAQMFIFFEAGFETSSTTMAFCLYELSKHRDIQEKVREEIKTVLKKYGDKMTYDAIMDMPYLEKVIFETLRKYPPATLIVRTCTKKYKVPGTDVVLDEGIKVLIPVYGIHHDPKYYVDPEQFDPERFSEENKKLRHDFAFLAFGEGPRMCIGMRFGLMQTKVGLITLLQHYEFNVSRKTIEPLQWDPKNIILSTLGDIWLHHEKI